MSEPGFLSRWSRRKHQAAKAKRTASNLSGQSGPAAETRAGVPKETARVEVQDAVALPEMSAEEIARLPRVEDLTITSDLTQFLREGVPKALRNAALRRIWVLDPAIRDFVSEAREYAYDWNVPGGVPGSGPLLADDDVKALVNRVIGDHQARPSSGAPAAAKEQSAEKAETGAEATGRDASNQPASSPEAAVPRCHGGAKPV
jgi:hypothetical protein